jgi:hypothetical protein
VQRLILYIQQYYYIVNIILFAGDPAIGSNRREGECTLFGWKKEKLEDNSVQG